MPEAGEGSDIFGQKLSTLKNCWSSSSLESMKKNGTEVGIFAEWVKDSGLSYNCSAVSSPLLVLDIASVPGQLPQIKKGEIMLNAISVLVAPNLKLGITLNHWFCIYVR